MAIAQASRKRKHKRRKKRKPAVSPPTQLRLQLSRPSLSAGAAIVEQYNAGSDPHNLVAERQGAVAFSFETLDPSGDQRQTVSLTRGTYTLYCSLLNHRDLGMQATLTVN
jgi:plastocyanin